VFSLVEMKMGIVAISEMMPRNHTRAVARIQHVSEKLRTWHRFETHTGQGHAAVDTVPDGLRFGHCPAGGRYAGVHWRSVE
jgi:hypothetical protein